MLAALFMQKCGCRFGKYELHDLVVLDQQTTGIIVGVEKDSCRVLTTEVPFAPSVLTSLDVVCWQHSRLCLVR